MGEKFWLSCVTSLIKGCPEDTVLVTNEGRQIGTWRLLLALHSPIMAHLLTSSSSSREGVVAISVPLSAEKTNKLLADMEEGEDALGGDKDMADLFGVKNCRFGEQIILKADAIPVTSPDKISTKVVTQSPIKVDNTCLEKNTSGFYIKRKNGFYIKSTTKSLENNFLQTSNESVFKSKQKKTILTSIKKSVKEMSFKPVCATNPGGSQHIDRKQEEKQSSGKTIDNDENVARSLENENKKIHVILEDMFDNKKEDIDRGNVGKSKKIHQTRVNKFSKRNSKTGDFIEKEDNDVDTECKQIPKDPHVSQMLKTEDIKSGLTFPDHDTMMTSINEWSAANFSPIVIGGGDGRVDISWYCPHASKKRPRITKKIRKDSVPQVACPLKLLLRKRKDGSWVVTQAVMEHQEHEVSEEMFQKYRKNNLIKVSPDQEAAVLVLMSQGAKATEIARMISNLTGREYSRTSARCLVKRLMDRAGLDSQTGERLLE